MSDRLVDWALAERLAVAIGGLGETGSSSPAARRAAPFGQAAVDAACDGAAAAVTAYSRLQPVGELPRPEAVDRAEWSRNVLVTMRELTSELERQVGGGVSVPGPLGSLVASLLRAGTGAEAGAAAGYASRKVLGQYDVALLGDERRARLLFVTPNLAAAHGELGGERTAFLRWVALHETTHAVQFASVPWLREHIGGLIGELVERAASGLASAGVRQLAARLLRSDPRRVVSALLRGEIARALGAGGQAELLERLQAAMAVVEGHAEHVMDAAGADPGLRSMRERLEARRARLTGIDAIVARLLGLDLKMRQYRLGKAFCDEVVAASGIETLNRVWSDATQLPTSQELAQPAQWLRRVEPAGATVRP